MAVQINRGRVEIYQRDANGLNADLLELLTLPNLESCHTIVLGTQAELKLETVTAMLETSLARTLKVLECQEILMNPETLEQLFEFELDSLTLAGGSAYEYPYPDPNSFPTLEPVHLAVLRSHQRLRQLKKLYLPNQYLENDTL